VKKKNIFESKLDFEFIGWMEWN